MELKRNLGGAILAIALGAATVTSAGDINVRWDPAAGASGYRVYYGTQAGQYTQVLDVGQQTASSVAGLQDCRDYFVAVKAYNANGESTAYSNEVSGWARPQINSAGPLAVQQGTQVTITLNGQNFDSSALLELRADPLPTDIGGNPLVRLESYTVSNCNRIEALVTIEPLQRGFRAMEVGDLDLTFFVSNPDSVFGDDPAVLTVVFDPYRADINRVDSTTRDRLDGQDLTWLRFAHGTTEGAARFNPDADLDGDGNVDGNDLALFATNFGDCWDGGAWSRATCE